MRGIPRQAAYQRTKILGTDKTANEIADAYSICGWNPDMYGVTPGVEGAQEYYDSIVSLYADWGVDFIKCDDICRMDADSSKEEIKMLHRAIEKCGRDIVLSLSPGPALVEENEFYHENANMWRITDDLWDNWESLRDMFDRCHNWQGLTREGGYPDCDMLPFGMIGKGFGDERKSALTYDEQKTMMTLWCIFQSPLMLGAELTKLDEETLVSQEERASDDVLDWIEANITDEYISSLINEEETEEKNYFTAHSAMCNKVKEQFPLFNENYIDELMDERYNEYCDSIN